MNMVTATVGEDGRLVGPSFAADPPDGFATLLGRCAGQHVRVGVRPEDVGVAGEHDWRSIATVRGSVEIVEAVGHEVIVHVRVGQDLIVARVRANRAPQFGETLELVINCDALHLFDEATQRRLDG